MQSKRLHLSWLILWFPFAFFSCHEEAEHVQPIEEIMPLKVGNQWHYQVTDFDTEGNSMDAGYFSRYVMKDTLIQGSRWYIISDGTIVRNSSEGYVLFERQMNQSYITYPSTAQGNVGYRYEYPSYTLQVLISRTFELAPVPNSSEGYRSYIFSFERQTLQPATSSRSTFMIKDYVTPEIGLVRSDRYFADSDKLFRRLELISFWVQ